MVSTLFFDPRFDTARSRASFVACKRPEGELSGGGEDGGDGIGDGRGEGVKGRSLLSEKLDALKEKGVIVTPFRTIGIGAVIVLSLGLLETVQTEWRLTL